MRTLFLTFLVLLALPVHAEEGFSLRSVAQKDDSYVVEVYVAHTAVPINAVEGTLTFPPSATLTRISTGGSVVGFWVEQPVIENDTIHFSGIFPGGFTNVIGGNTGGDGLLFSVQVANTVSATLEDSAYFLNDGEGTRIEMPDITKKLSETDDIKTTTDDTAPPEWILVERVRADELVLGKDMLLISAYDAGSGIAYFEVKESGGEWKRTQTPYLIENDSLFNRIEVRAYDYAGNVKKESVLSPIERTALTLLPYLLGGVLLILFLVYLSKRLRRTI